MIRQAVLALASALLLALCYPATNSNAQEKDGARAKELQSLLDFLKAKGVELKVVEKKEGGYIQSWFSVGPDHDKKHYIGLNYLPPLTLEKAREDYMAYSLPYEFHGHWALFMIGGPRGNATPEYEADWKKVLAALLTAAQSA